MIRVLTVSRQFGSGGAAVAQLVAETLGWRVVDGEIIDSVVAMAGVDRDAAERCDERLDPIFHRLLKSLWQGGFERSTAQIGSEPFDSESMTRCSRVVIEQAAEAGNCVIVGRGAQCVLADRLDTLHVFLWAPREHRAARIRQRLPAEHDPEARMDKVDRARQAFIRREFHADWCDHRLYDLVIDSALGIPVTADCIVAAIRGASSTHA